MGPPNLNGTLAENDNAKHRLALLRPYDDPGQNSLYGTIEGASGNSVQIINIDVMWWYLVWYSNKNRA